MIAKVWLPPGERVIGKVPVASEKSELLPRLTPETTKGAEPALDRVKVRETLPPADPSVPKSVPSTVLGARSLLLIKLFESE